MQAHLNNALALAGLYCQDGRARFVRGVSNGFAISSSGQWRVMDIVPTDLPAVSILNTETQFHFTMTHHQIRQDLKGVV